MLVVTDPMLWHKVAAVSGVAALGLGTYGAHMFRPKNPTYKEVWHTASLYHLVHTAVLLGTPITKRPDVVPWRAPHCWNRALLWNRMYNFVRCYTMAYLEDRKFSSPAPLGGFAFIAAWASLLCVYYVWKVRTELLQHYGRNRKFYLKRKRFDNYRSEMARSLFCLCPLGWAPWSPRLVESVLLGCIPVIIADNIRLSFPPVLQWQEISLQVAEKDSQS
ncbi:putative glucuronosyltransferase [Zea mays]|uniref:Putative glucuronosyltransferase n=1 Tax=Zea mays TaxID=4577 RepID=A0A3L6FEI3_MAIZE|nr:putative glucuronosyltransferase [Zea mays]